MSKVSFALLATAVACLRGPAQAQTGPGTPPIAPIGVELTVRVTGLDRPEGYVRIAVFDREEAFTEEPLVAGSVLVSGPEASWKTHLPPGAYAVAVVHDSDGDGGLDRNLLGIPTEEYGFSRAARAPFGPPSFSDARFVILGSTHAETIEVR